MTPDTSGPTLRVPLAHYDPDSSSWKTSGVMFPSDWPTSSETCPAWGMTRAGELFELPTPALPTDAPASSSLPTPTARDHKGHNQRHDSSCLTGALLPTPGANDRTGAEAREARGAGGPSLRDLPTLLPTPLASDGEKGGPNQRGGSGDLRLSSAVHLLPTPAVNDMGAGKTPEEWDAWTARMQERHGNGNWHGASLSIEALRLLPTPTAMDAHGSRGYQPNGEPYTKTAGVTLTDAALASSGAHTPPRLRGGKASSDDPHPTPPNPDATDDPDCLPFSSSG